MSLNVKFVSSFSSPIVKSVTDSNVVIHSLSKQKVSRDEKSQHLYCCFTFLALDTFLCKNSTTLVNGSMCLPSRTYSRPSYKRLNETTGTKQTMNSFYNFLTGGTRQVSLSGVGMGSLRNYGGRRRSEILRDSECHVTVA